MTRAGESERIAAAHRHEGGRLRVLHLIIMLGETNGQYNEHCLPLIGSRDLSLCTYFKPQLEPPSEIKVYAGDDTLAGFFRALELALRSGEYDIVHAHAPHTGALATFALAIHSKRWRLWRKLVYTVQDSYHDYKLRNKLLMLPPLAASRRIVFCGQAAYESYPALWKRMVGRRRRIIPNAADLDRIECAIAGTKRGRNGEAFEIVSVGRLEKVKDPLTLLAAFHRSADNGSHLAFIGAGSLEDELLRATRKSGLEDRVHLAGLIPRDDVFVRCAEADLFVSASLGEGLPVAVIEAMATGCPVILSDIPPHREVAQGIDFVPFVQPGDTDGFAREIDRFRMMSPGARAALGLRCRELARSRFGLSTMHTAYEKVYSELL